MEEFTDYTYECEYVSVYIFTTYSYFPTPITMEKCLDHIASVMEMITICIPLLER